MKANIWTVALVVTGFTGAPVLAQSDWRAAFEVDQTPSTVTEEGDSIWVTSHCECGDVESCCDDLSCADDCGGDDLGCGDECGCGDVCGSGCGGFDPCCCDLGDPCTLKGLVAPCCGWDFGGWINMGYRSDNVRLSHNDNDLLSFGDNPGQVHLHQAWMYVEKVAEASACSADWGFRADVVYGIDAQKTQAFGNPNASAVGAGTWDASLDHGSYGWAIPQLYGELAMGDWSVIAGHFYTLVGYEVVTAPDNFFFSHAFTMFNSEPFTHTGAVATYSGMDDIEVYAGWTLGWDTGFDQNNGGSNWLGGFSATLTDDVTFTYISYAGNLGARGNMGDSDGYGHSLVFDVALTDSLNYILQSDYVQTGSDATAREDVGINQYLIYTLNDCWGVGGRFEWWKTDSLTPSANSFYAITGGVNYRASANLIIRPEIRYDWTPGEDVYNATQGTTAFNQTSFGVDAILTF